MVVVVLGMENELCMELFKMMESGYFACYAFLVQRGHARAQFTNLHHAVAELNKTSVLVVERGQVNIKIRVDDE